MKFWFLGSRENFLFGTLGGRSDSVQFSYAINGQDTNHSSFDVDMCNVYSAKMHHCNFISRITATALKQMNNARMTVHEDSVLYVSFQTLLCVLAVCASLVCSHYQTKC